MIKKLKKIGLVAGIACFFSSGISAEDFIRAFTEEGRGVELMNDGTWRYSPAPEEEGEADETSSEKGEKPASAAAHVDGSRVEYRIYYDDAKWRIAKNTNDSAEYTFRHKNGDGYAMVISERISIPLKSLEKIALENARKVAQDVRLVNRSVRIVNGRKLVTLSIEGVMEGIPFKYYGYYASGKWGSIQFLTFTAIPIFAEYENDFTELLNGLTIQE